MRRMAPAVPTSRAGRPQKKGVAGALIMQRMKLVHSAPNKPATSHLRFRSTASVRRVPFERYVYHGTVQ